MTLRKLKSVVRRILPQFALTAYHRRRESRLNDFYRTLQTEEVFTDIYLKNRWGGPAGTFYSGLGSNEAAAVSPYLDSVRSEFHRLGTASLAVVDLGCGDFSVGRQIAAHFDRYIGVDIVKPLIDYNRKTFGGGKVSFVHANMVTDDLPDSDVCLVRQVFQHLSNQQIQAVLPKLDRYRWSFITEHHPSPSSQSRPNTDKPHGGGIRASQQSGVFLEQPPFNIPTNRYRLLAETPGTAVPGEVDRGVIRTFVLEGTSASRR